MGWNRTKLWKYITKNFDIKLNLIIMMKIHVLLLFFQSHLLIFWHLFSLLRRYKWTVTKTLFNRFWFFRWLSFFCYFTTTVINYYHWCHQFRLLVKDQIDVSLRYHANILWRFLNYFTGDFINFCIYSLGIKSVKGYLGWFKALFFFFWEQNFPF